MAEIQSRRGKSLSQATEFIIEQRLWIRILIGMALGFAIGFMLSPHGLQLIQPSWVTPTAEWLALPGQIFLGLIKMVIVPLILCSIILGIAETNDMDFLRKIAFRLIPYFILTTALAITIGIMLVNIIQPGLVVDQSLAEKAINSSIAAGHIPSGTFDDLTIPQRIGNIIPDNPAQAQLERNMLQLVIAAILVGIALMSIPKDNAKPFRDLCESGQIISMKIISWAMLIAPYAVFGLIANVTINLGLQAILSVGLYSLTVLLGLGCMLIVYMAVIALLTRSSPLEFLKNIREPQLLAFSTSSSAATMPFSIQTAEEKLGVKPEIARVVIPVGATVNMDGTALYQGVAALFLCQFYGIDLDLTQTILLIVTTVGASIGTPAAPRVGLVILSTILVGIGVPIEGLALLIGVDALLDMCRTTINVTGDLTATKLMDKWINKK